MSVADLAVYLGVTAAWVYNNHRALGLPARKIGGTCASGWPTLTGGSISRK